jgi:iron complex outermembrane receptor protein
MSMTAEKNPRIRRAHLLASTAFICTLFAAGQARAAEDTVPEVTVTARHITETLKDTPVAVSAFSEDQLLTQGAQDITDLTYMTPSTSLFVGRGSNSTLTAYIRGVGQQDPTWGSEPGVGIYVDDVYYARPQASVLDIYNVSQIEVLRGPQGTLYGRNTIGGAVKYVTADLPDHFTADARASYGSYNEHDFVGSFAAPITDKIRIGAAIADYNHDGWGKDLTTGAAIDNRDMVAGRLSVELLPTDDITVKISADRTMDMSNANPGHKEVAYGGFPITPNDYDSYAGESSRNYVMDEGVSLTATWSIDPDWTLKSISAYRQGNTKTNIDFDGLPGDFLGVPGVYSDNQKSEEVQAAYTGGRLRGVAGVFYMDSTAAGYFDEELANLGLTDLLSGSVVTNSWAGYADGSFDITDQWTISAGGRYSYDEKSGQVFNAFYLGLASPPFGGPAQNPLVVNTNYSNHKSWGKFTPRVSLSYKVTPDITSYVSYAEGFRSGGFDIRGNGTFTPQTVNGYNPEKVDTYEIGLKGNYFGHKLSLNLDGYYSQYKDQQVGVQIPTAGGVESVIENAGTSHIEGVELEATAKLFGGLSATAVGAYTYAQFDTLPVLNGIPPLRGFQYSPKWTGSLDLTYAAELGDGLGSLTTTGSLAYRSFTQLYDTPSVIDQPGYTVVDANIIWTAPSGAWSLSLKGANLTDERYRIGGYNLNGAVYGNSVVGFYGAPRTFLSTVSAHF